MIPTKTAGSVPLEVTQTMGLGQKDQIEDEMIVLPGDGSAIELVGDITPAP